MSAQKTVNQIYSIEPCLSATSSGPYCAGVGLTVGAYFRLLRRHPKHPFLDVRVECVGLGGLQVVSRNLRLSPMTLVSRSSEPFLNDEGWLCMVAVARWAVVQPAVKPEAKHVRLAQPSRKE